VGPRAAETVGILKYTDRLMAELSYTKGPEAPLWEMTLADALARTTARFPDRMALIVRHQNLRYTWREFDAMVTRVARGLSGLGLRPRDRVGIWSSNCAEWILPQYACARAGYVLVCVNPAYRSHELGYVLGGPACARCFCGRKMSAPTIGTF